MTAGEAPCPVCGNEQAQVSPDGESKRVSCPVCGEFVADRTILSAVCRHHHERGQRLRITEDNLEQLVETAPLPRTPLDAVENLLLYLGDRQKSFSQYVQIPLPRFPVTAARNEEDFRYVSSLLLELGFGEVYDDAFREGFRLTAPGWKRLGELRASRPDSRQAFVAMWFADEMAPAWRDGIHPALEATGYRAVRIDAVQHNEQIDDRIVAEIRRSGLVVANFTGGRGGVYFEAGFAMGLGIPVIWTCRADHIGHVHFDTRQYNHILWERPDDLREKLRLRVEATLPQKPAARGSQ
jgi:nucleoside 2-deoxyribosyltransferase